MDIPGRIGLLLDGDVIPRGDAFEHVRHLSDPLTGDELAEQGEDAAEDLFSYYGVETAPGKRPAKKIEANGNVVDMPK